LSYSALYFSLIYLLKAQLAIEVYIHTVAKEWGRKLQGATVRCTRLQATVVHFNQFKKAM